VSAQQTFVLTLQSERGRDGIRDLRFLLKIAKRHLHLRAIDVREHQTIHRRDARRGLCSSPSVEMKGRQMTNLRKFGPQNRYIKLDDLKDKPPLRERIGLVKVENGKFGERIVLVFEPSRKMVSLNVTSAGNLLRDFGGDDSDWVGRLVEIYAGTVKTKSGTMDAVLMQAIVDEPVDTAVAAKAVKAAKATAEKERKASDMDDEIPF
jgi:hypothetical protein